MRLVISTNDGPKAIGPYSQAIEANGLVFLSGQISLDPATQQLIAGDVAAQTERVLQNIQGILRAAGTSLQQVVKTTVFLKSMNDFTAMNEVYARHFTADPPARSTVEVARLPKDVLVEIDVIALAE
ncbi:MAG TPA: RidA family protein [Candidatus Eisenbacteria bacterium]|nr:RidA family protein [Candidatus Eisenbacteria bacterium]